MISYFEGSIVSPFLLCLEVVDQKAGHILHFSFHKLRYFVSYLNSLFALIGASALHTNFFRYGISALVLALSQFSHAGLVVDISNAVAGNSQFSKNKPNNIIGNKTGYFGANIYTDDAISTDITIEFLGSQAKWDVFFTFSNDDSSWVINNHPNGSQGVVKAKDGNRQKGMLSVSANQLLNFSFAIDDRWKGKGVDWTVNNGSNDMPRSLDGSGRYFWTGFEYSKSGAISAIVLGLDDGGGEFDGDNDDLMVRISGFGAGSLYSGSGINPPQNLPVPVPAAAWMFGSAMGALAGLAKRSKS